MEFSIDQQYKLNRLVLSIYGLWPYQSRTTNTWIKRILTILIIIYSLVSQIIKICMTEFTVDFILDCLPVIIPNISMIVQFLHRMIINDKLRSLFDQIKIDWECAKSQNEIEIMQANAALGKVTTKWLLLYVIIGMTVYMLSTFIPQVLDVFVPLNESRSREHPYHAELFLDEEKYFYTIRLIMYLGIVYVLGVTVINGAIFVVYMQHARGMFIILGHRAERSFSDSDQLAKSRFTREKDYENVTHFVEDHRNVLQFVDLIQSCYGLSVFVEFLIIVLTMGISMVQIIKFSGTSDRSFRSIAYSCGLLAYMFMYSYVGQQLTDKSAELSMKIFYSKWYSASLWKQKMMLLVMLKCTCTITINAYNVYIISLESFSAIVQTAVSICMLLRRV